MRGRSYVIGSTVIAALGGLLFGFDTAVISGTTEALTEVFDLSSGELGLTVASALFGTIIGAALVGKPADMIGRKMVLLVLAGLYFISAVGSALAWDWWSLMAFRVVGGLAVGGASVVSPMYTAEISPPHLRGRLVAVTQFNVVLGILLAYFSNYLIGVFIGGQAGVAGAAGVAWRWMFGVEAIPAAAFFFLTFMIPFSPRWLVKRHRSEEAREVLDRLGAEDPDRVLAEIVDSLTEREGRVAEPLFQRKYRVPILTAFAVASFNQLAGINAIIYYTASIFQMAGAGYQSALLQSVAVGLANLIFTVIAMSIIDRVGRKFLLMVGSLGMVVCLGIVAAAFYRDTGGLVVLGGLIGYIAFFAFSQGTVIWVYISEIFPNRVRAKGQALGSFTHWGWNAIVSGVFPVIAVWGAGHAFAFFAFMMIVQFFFVWQFLPETRGVSLEAIQRKLGIE